MDMPLDAAPRPEGQAQFYIALWLYNRYTIFMHPALQALAEPNRMAILSLLRDGERPAGDFVDALPISQPAVSKHLSVLREAGLVTVRKDAQRRLYSLNPKPLAEIDAWLASYRQLWTNRLDALERHLDNEFPQ